MGVDEQIYDLIANNIAVLASGDIEIALDLPAKIIATLPPARAAEAVAWRVKNEFGRWFITQNKALAAAWQDLERFEVETLYTSPPQEQGAAPKGEAVALEKLDEKGWMLVALAYTDAINGPFCNEIGAAKTAVAEYFRLTAPPSPKAESVSTVEAVAAILRERVIAPDERINQAARLGVNHLGSRTAPKAEPEQEAVAACETELDKARSLLRRLWCVAHGVDDKNAINEAGAFLRGDDAQCQRAPQVQS